MKNKKINFPKLAKNLATILLAIGFFVCLQICWQTYLKSTQINKALVESNKPWLNEKLIKTASGLLSQ